MLVIIWLENHQLVATTASGNQLNQCVVKVCIWASFAYVIWGSVATKEYVQNNNNKTRSVLRHAAFKIQRQLLRVSLTASSHQKKNKLQP